MSESDEHHLGILLTCGLNGSQGPAALEAAHDALAHGEKVHLFLMIDGVRWATDPALTALHNARAQVSLCTLNADERNITEAAAPHVDWSSQYRLAQIVAESDRFLSYT